MLVAKVTPVGPQWLSVCSLSLVVSLLASSVRLSLAISESVNYCHFEWLASLAVSGDTDQPTVKTVIDVHAVLFK